MLLNYILPFTNNKIIKERLLVFQNLYALFFVSYSLYSIYDWITSSNTITLYNTSILMRYFLSFDVLFCSNDLIIHHIAAISIIHSSIICTSINSNLLPIFYSNDQFPFYVTIIYSTELSTLFLIFKSLANQFKIKNKLTAINDLLFLTTFVYTRIYLYSRYLILNKQMYNLFQENLSPLYNNIICASVYTLYILNLYWFSLIIKKLVKSLPKLSSLYCEKALKYTYLLSLFGSLYLYRPYQNILFAIDIIGQGILCISSYEYHYSVELELAKGIPEDKIDVLSNHIIWKYLNDIICIHIRCFCCVLVHTNLFSGHITAMNLAYAYLSFILHSLSIYNYVKFITELKNKGETFYLTEQGTYKNDVINFLSGSAIVMDTLICMTNTNFSVRTNLLIITFIIYIYSYVRPLYNMTHLGLHILLGFQTLALCQSNIVANII
jgi:hypothetical protein